MHSFVLQSEIKNGDFYYISNDVNALCNKRRNRRKRINKQLSNDKAEKLAIVYFQFVLESNMVQIVVSV